ncbi:DUF4296 domain-containing protein [uncultured Chitinophaga sp.]|uniref:DUF4296 domain-containing protein n=1 Tax=uncultured Chitinophaga sp. TaxID=339340 RepID=UPI0025DDA5ED|nr:DUF4296 domain-containing protein [uncultured Chitinophaga sp.]
MRRTAFLLFIFTAFAIACGDAGKVPKGIIGKDKMKDILTDMTVAQVYGNDIVQEDTIPITDSIRELRVKTYYSQILSLHKVSVKEFMDSYAFYESHPDVLEEVFKKMESELASKKAYLDTLETRKQQKITDSLNKIQKMVDDSLKAVQKADSIAGKSGNKADSIANKHRLDSLAKKHKIDSIAGKHKLDSISARRKMDSLLRKRLLIETTAKNAQKRLLDSLARKKRQDSLRKVLRSKPIIKQQ